MRLTAPTDALRAAVKACGPAISGRPHMPILAGVRLLTTNDALSLRAFDGDTDIATVLNARVGTPGETLVSHRLLGQVLAATRAATVTLVVDGTRLAVTAGRAEWRLPVMTITHYPASPEPVRAVGSVDGEAFRDAVERVTSAAATIPALDLPLHVTCVNLDVDDVTLVSTDKYQLHTATLPLKRASEDATPYVLIPAERLAAIARSLTGDTVNVHLSPKRAAFSDDVTTVSTSLATSTSGDWVQWRTLFTGLADGHRYVFDRDDLVTALKQAVLVADQQEGNGARHITLTVGREEALIQTLGNQDGDAVVPCPVTGYDQDEPLTWVVNGDFLISGVLAADTDPVQLTQRSPKHPVGLGPVDQPPTQIVMPIRGT